MVITMEVNIDDIKASPKVETSGFEKQNHEDMPSDYEMLMVRRAITRSRLTAPDVDKEWNAWKTRNVSIETDHPAPIKRSVPALHATIKWMLAAAAVIAFIFAFHELTNQKENFSNEVFTANPGSTDIVLSLDDKQMNVVNKSSLTFVKKESEQKSIIRHIKMVTLSTPRGKNISLTLPDGTKVWLNADSKIEFPELFVGKERNVRISGEAYMEVAPDKSHPFIVSTDFFKARVLGTVFDIRSYGKQDASLALISGSVEISDLEDTERHVLHPDEQVVWKQDAGFDISSVDTYPITQWKDGYFYFNNTSLVSIMQELGRWYNVSVVFEKTANMQHLMHIVAERNEPLEKILKRINDLDVVRIELTNDVITVK